MKAIHRKVVFSCYECDYQSKQKHKSRECMKEAHENGKVNSLIIVLGQRKGSPEIF